ncbi:MerR family transcriptional regulator [Streptomyces sp. LX-29]|uniref:MerR family transcriptional regulator n=1 Tax=Streptomyces sp. LX-29 TaxID=2900152 RepID=UPI00240E0634|nr:MerR family transcriptional regulator [Streptomyces sp. LX-29]WFB07246.1 MerR family transcriptional regulator [Streptomyces sp. LX-29]
MEYLSIGAFARESRLSPKALRLYDRLGLLVPDHVDAATGYRWYRAEQVGRARLVALLRRLDMPLARIATVLELPGPRAADEVAAFWAEIEEHMVGRRALAAHLRARLSGRRPDMYDVTTREVPEQTVLALRKHLLSDDLPAWIGSSLDLLEKAAVEECGGVAGHPFVVYHADVSDESDGPAEACVPVADPEAARAYAAAHRTVEVRTEPGHRVAYTRLTKGQVVYPQILSAYEAVEGWIADQGLSEGGPCREVYFADWPSAGPSDEVCDIAYPIG